MCGLRTIHYLSRLPQTGLHHQNRCISRLDCTSKGISDVDRCAIVLAQEDPDDPLLSAFGHPIVVIDGREQDERMHNHLCRRQCQSLRSRGRRHLQHARRRAFVAFRWLQHDRQSSPACAYSGQAPVPPVSGPLPGNLKWTSEVGGILSGAYLACSRLSLSTD